MPVRSSLFDNLGLAEWTGEFFSKYVLFGLIVRNRLEES
jgi:hypothetical protein